jgi:PAS domain S-box-containing protein
MSLLTWITFLISSISVSLPSVLAQVDTFNEQWRWVRFTTESGLPTNDAKYLHQTPSGTIWTGTYHGLAWFDGYQWNEIGPEEGLPEGNLQDMRMFSNDSVLVVIDGRVYLGGKEGFEHVSMIVNGAELNVRSAIDFNNDTILILADGKLYQYKNGAVSRYPLLLEDTADPQGIACLWRTRRGPWLATWTGLYQWTGSDWICRLSTPEGYLEFRQPKENSRGVTFVYATPPSPISGPWVLQNDITPLRLDYEEEWGAVISEDVGPSGDVLTVYAIAGTKAYVDGNWIDVQLGRVKTNSISYIKYDFDGNLWVMTREGIYLHRHSSSRWDRIRFPDGDPRNSVNEIINAADNTIWIGSSQGVVVRSPDGSTDWIQMINGIKLGVVTALAEDREGNIWVDSGVINGGVFRWNGSIWEHFGRREGLTAAGIHRIASDGQGRLWFLGLGETYPGPGIEDSPQPGAFVFSENQFECWDTGTGLLNGRVYSFAEDESGRLWFGTFGGLSRWDGEGWTHWSTEDGTIRDSVYSLCIDGSNRIWFAHHGSGLGYVEADTLTYVKMSDGLISSNVWEVENDDSGRLWISTWAGLSFFDGESWISFSPISGLSSARIWPILPVGDRVYVGTVESGVDILNLSDVTANNPRVEISDVAFDGGDVFLHWQAFSYYGELEPLQIDTRYRLNEDSWSEWSRLREIKFESLSPGDYSFTVQARNTLGTYDESGFTTLFSVAIPFYFSPPFLLPIGLLLFISIYLWADLRKRRKAYIADLYESEERYRTLFDRAPFGIVIHDNESILFTNPAGAKLLGFREPAEASNRPLLEHIPIDEWDMVRNYLSRGTGENDKIPLREISLFRTDRSEIEIEWEVTPYVYVGFPAYLSVFIDVTDRKHLEAQLLQAQKMQAVGALAGGIAHDFNNLLTAISGYSEVMLENMKKRDKSRPLVEEVRLAADRAIHLTNQLLVFSRQEVIETRILDLSAVIEGMVEMLKYLIGENIDLVIECDPYLDCINADQGQLEQLIMNLVLNSRDAMPGGGRIAINARNMVLEDGDGGMEFKLDPGPYVMVSVSDNGSGIPEEISDRIFEPFFTTKEPGHGTGLGLATVHGIVQRFGGDIRVGDNTDGGTYFRVLFPRTDGDDTVSFSEEVEIAVGEGSGTVLVVEDEYVVRNYVERVLDDSGYRVITASDGAEAIQISSGFPDKIDILVTDVMMPVMDGKELADNLLRSRPNLKVLFLSGYADEVIGRADLLKSGQDFQKKPVKPKQLVLKIQELLAGQ